MNSFTDSVPRLKGICSDHKRGRKQSRRGHHTFTSLAMPSIYPPTFVPSTSHNRIYCILESSVKVRFGHFVHLDAVMHCFSHYQWVISVVVEYAISYCMHERERDNKLIRFKVHVHCSCSFTRTQTCIRAFIWAGSGVGLHVLWAISVRKAISGLGRLIPNQEK
jgi:hypothetical protein